METLFALHRISTIERVVAWLARRKEITEYFRSEPISARRCNMPITHFFFFFFFWLASDSQVVTSSLKSLIKMFMMSAILNFLKDITRNENKLRKCPQRYSQILFGIIMIWSCFECFVHTKETDRVEGVTQQYLELIFI